MKLAIFGLSGDPVTSAHLEIITRLSNSFDKVIVIPTNINYYKSYKNGDHAMFSFQERYDNLLAKCAQFSNVVVSDVERNAMGEWRFIHTLKAVLHLDLESTNYEEQALMLKNAGLDVYIAMGSDSLQNFKSWYEWENILKLAKLVVFNRPGYTQSLPEDINYEYLPMNNSTSSTKLREKLVNFMEADDDFNDWIDDLTWGKSLKLLAN